MFQVKSEYKVEFVIICQKYCKDSYNFRRACKFTKKSILSEICLQISKQNKCLIDNQKGKGTFDSVRCCGDIAA